MKRTQILWKKVLLEKAHFLQKNLTSTNSGVNLKGELSNPKFLGEQDKINP